MTDLPTDKIQAYVNSNKVLSSEIQSIEKFGDGQSNPTYLLSTATKNYVLRRKPFGELLKSAHAVDREYRVISALKQSHFPVPSPVHYCDDANVIGSEFYLMSYEPGRVFWDPALPELNRLERADVFDQMNQTLARLHEIDFEGIGLTTFGKPGDYFARQIARWTKQYRASETSRLNDMEELITWLPANLPLDDGAVSLIHGDFRLDNIIYYQNRTEIRAVLDWELSTLGHPFADLAYQCMQLRLPRDCIIAGLGDLNRTELGIPTEEEYVERYCRRRQLNSIPNWHFYLIFSFFRFAAILQGVGKRAEDGNASSDKAFEYGKLAPTLASMATELIN